MSTSLRNRVRAGVTEGGQFATQAKSEPDLSLPLVAVHRPRTTAEELAKAQADRERLEKKTAKAARRVATFELANIAQIAVEHDRSATEFVLRKEPGPEGAQKLACVAVFDADHDNPVEPARWWSDDLAKVRIEEAEDTGLVGGWSYWRNEPIADVSIETVLAAEKRLLGKNHNNPHFDRRGDAREQLTKARTDYARATAHALLADADQHVAGVGALVIEDDDGQAAIAGLLDEDREDLDEDDWLDWHEDNNEPVEGLRAEDFVTAGVGVPQPDGTVIVPMDAVRRLRGVADDPNQKSLFGNEGDLSQYGWTGRAA